MRNGDRKTQKGVWHNRADTRKRKQYYNQKVCVCGRLFCVTRGGQNVFDAGPAFCGQLVATIFVGVAGFGKKRLDVVPDRRDRGCGNIFRVCCFSDTRRLVAKMLTMLVRVERARRTGPAYNVQPTLITMLSRVGFTKPPRHAPPTHQQHTPTFLPPTP